MTLLACASPDDAPQDDLTDRAAETTSDERGDAQPLALLASPVKLTFAGSTGDGVLNLMPVDGLSRNFQIPKLRATASSTRTAESVAFVLAEPTDRNVQVGVAGVRFQGPVLLPAGASARVTFLRYLNGTREEGEHSYTLKGPISGSLREVKVDVEGEGAPIIWTRCGSSTSINTLVTVAVDRGSAATASIGGVEELIGKTQIGLRFVTRPCR